MTQIFLPDTAQQALNVIELNAYMSHFRVDGIIEQALAEVAANDGGALTFSFEGPCPTYGGFLIPEGTVVWSLNGGYRPDISKVKNCLQMQTASSNGFVFAGAQWGPNTTHADIGVQFHDMPIDLNGCAVYALCLAARNCNAYLNNIWNWSGAFSPIVFGSNTATTDTMNNNNVFLNILQIVDGLVATPNQHAVWLTKLNQAITDTEVYLNLCNGCGDTPFQFDSGGNNNCWKNHASTLVADGSAMIFYALMAGCDVWGNTMDDTSRPNVAGQINSMLHIAQLEASPLTRPSSVHDNNFHADESHGVTPAATWQYIRCDTVQAAGGSHNGYLSISRNKLTQDAAGAGTSVGYALTAGVGNTLIVPDWDPGSCVGTSPAPTIGGAGSVALGGVPLSTQPATPATTVSVTEVMAGLAIPFTCVHTGNFMVQVTGGIETATGAAQGTVKLRFGTGGAPANGAAPTGTIISNINQAKASAANTLIPFTLLSNRVVSGQPLNTPMWIDIGYLTSAGADALTITNLQVVVEEVL